jgi:hypothetical protein
MGKYEKMKMMLEEMSRAGRWREWGNEPRMVPTPSSESKNMSLLCKENVNLNRQIEELIGKLNEIYEENVKLNRQIEELNEKIKVMSTVDLYEENIRLKKEIKKLKSDISWKDVGRTYPATFK